MEIILAIVGIVAAVVTGVISWLRARRTNKKSDRDLDQLMQFIKSQTDRQTRGHS